MLSRRLKHTCFLVGLTSGLLLAVAGYAETPGEASSQKHKQWLGKEDAAEEAFAQGRAAEADQLFKEALELSDKSSAVDRAATLNQMGVAMVKQRRFSEADRLLQQAVDIRMKELGAENAVTLQSLSNLALVKHRLGDEKDSENLYKQCIEAKRKTAPQSISLAKTLTNLANLYSDERRLNEAKKLYQEALDIDTSHYGAAHIEVATDLFNLGVVLQRNNEWKEAIDYFARAEKLFESAGDKYGTVKALHYKGLSQAKIDQHEEAYQSFEAARALHEQLKGKGHPDTLVHMLNAADESSASGDNTLAEKTYKQALAHAENAKHPSNLRLAECNLELAQFYRKQNKPDEAEQYFRKALVHYDHLTHRQKRALYELPEAYSHLLKDLKRDEESQRMAHKYVHVFAPAGQSRH